VGDPLLGDQEVRGKTNLPITGEKHRHEIRNVAAVEILNPDVRRTKELGGRLVPTVSFPEGAERVNGIWSDQVGVAQGQRLSRVIDADAASCQNVLRIDRIRDLGFDPSYQIARKKALLVAELIIEPDRSLQVVLTQRVSGRDSSTGIRGLGKSG